MSKDKVSEKDQVLVLQMIPGIEMYEHIKHFKSDYQGCDLHFAPIPEANECWMKTYERCCQLVDTKGINYCLISCDRGAFILGALQIKYPHLKGPSLEGFYLTADKYNTRKKLIPNQYNLSYCDITGADYTKEFSPMTFLGDIKLPLIAKPALGTASTKVMKITNGEDLFVLKKFFNKENLGIMEPVKKLLETFLNLEVYPKALQPSYILEAYVDHTSGATVHGVDGFAVDGKFVSWGFCDNVYWDHNPECFLGVAIPTALSPALKTKANEMAALVVEKMAVYGFNHQFLDIEFFCFPDGSLKVMEINGRALNMMKWMYTSITENGNMYRAILDIQQGKPYKPPVFKPNTLGLYAYLTTFGTGKVADFIDIEQAYQVDQHVEILKDPSQEVIQTSPAGYTFGYINLIGSSVKDCVKQMDKIKHKFLKKPDVSPWFHCENN